MNQYKFGDLVLPTDPEAAGPIHGIVVLYHGKHDRKAPRVRWNTGWATSTKAEYLKPMPNHLRITLPVPQLYECDLP